MYDLHLFQLFLKIAGKHSAITLELAVIVVQNIFFMFSHFLIKPSWSRKVEAKKDPYTTTETHREIRCLGRSAEFGWQKFYLTSQYNILNFYISSPAIKGCKNNPAVPRIHTRMKTHRKIRSITMATYFQSS